MEIEFIKRDLAEIDADIEIVVVVNKDFDHKFVVDSKELLEAIKFEGNQDEVALLPESKKIFVGSESLESNDIRSAVATAVRSLLSKGYESAKIATYSRYEKCTATVRAQAEALSLGSYYYNRYKSSGVEVKLQKIIISSEPYDKLPEVDSLEAVVERGLKIGSSVNQTRDIVNTPPNDFYPKKMAKVAKDIAKRYNLEIDILKKKDIEKEKMGALLAVARASSKAPRVIHLAYKPENATHKVALIGKGLTYDSGGLSLKPSDFMVTMKLDKSGAAAVLGVLRAVASLKLPVEVHGFIGAVENMVGGNAYKPDDVLVSKSGKTIEVKNTDAEGRLVLADVLTFAQERVDADYYIDIATLTGACAVGVGSYTMGVLGNSKKLIDKFKDTATLSAGEMAAHLPFNRHLRKTLKSDIADICNISNTRYGGAITAGMFLDFFIEEKNRDKWLHLDIAGPAFVEHNWGENPSGASGVGVRSITRFIEKLNKRH